MGAGYHGGFGKTKGATSKGNGSSGEVPVAKFPTFNHVKSKSVKVVETARVSHNIHSVPVSAEPNSVHISMNQGKLHSERYFDAKGSPYLDIDYTNHGNPKIHPVVPHEHTITVIDGKFIRDKKWRYIQKWKKNI